MEDLLQKSYLDQGIINRGRLKNFSAGVTQKRNEEPHLNRPA